MLVLAGGGLVGVGALTIYGALTGRLAAILAAMFRPGDLEEDGYFSSAATKAAIAQATDPNPPPSTNDPTLGGILPAPAPPPPYDPPRPRPGGL